MKLAQQFEMVRKFRAEDPSFAIRFWNKGDAQIAAWLVRCCHAADVRIGEKALATIVRMMRWDEAPETVRAAREAAKVRARLGVAS